MPANPTPTQEAPTYTVGNVMVGVASLYTAPAGTAIPPDTTVQNGIGSVSPWVAVGATEEGVSLQWQRNTQDINIEEQSIPASVQVTTSNFHINTSLSEDTVASMKLAYGGGTLSTQAATTLLPAVQILTLSDTLDQLAVVFESLNPQGWWRRLYIPSVLSVAEVTTAYRRAANNRSYSVNLRAVCALSQIQLREQTGAHT